jgi:hypothetical protein
VSRITIVESLDTFRAPFLNAKMTWREVEAFPEVLGMVGMAAEVTIEDSRG